jgi:glycosyltransferase involved in cell wall biosynthesis
LKIYSQTIVIPTRNRQETAIFAVQSCLMAKYENKQIVIVDNSDDDSLRNLLADGGCLNNVCYHKNERVLSMRDNWEQGVELADGELISIIGDDDAILNASMEVANFAFNRAEIDVFCGGTAIYKWPNYPFQGRRNFLSFEFGEEIRIHRDPQKILKEAYQYNVNLGTGPGIYCGFARKDFLNRLKKQRGKFFIDLQPDFDSGYATLLYSKAYATSGRPLFIQGHSAKSNSGGMRYTYNRKENINTFVSESKQSLGEMIGQTLGEIGSNGAVIVGSQIRFKAEIERILGSGNVELDKKKAWDYIKNELSEGYDLTGFISAIPALKRLSEEWGIPYALSNNFKPSVPELSIQFHQGFIKSKPLNNDGTNGPDLGTYKTAVVNGETLGFKSIIDAVKHIDAMLPTMRVSPDKEVSERAIRITKGEMEVKLLNARNYIKLYEFDNAMILLDEIISAGEIGLNIDSEIKIVAENINNHEWASRYFARRFSATGKEEELVNLIAAYKKIGADELIKKLRIGLSQLEINNKNNG